MIHHWITEFRLDHQRWVPVVPSDFYRAHGLYKGSNPPAWWKP